MRSLIQLYALTVCFATLMCLIVALGIGVYDLLQIASPGFTVDVNAVWASDEHYLTYHPDKQGLPAEELEALRVEQRSVALQGERRAAQQSCALMAIIVCIDALVYGVHWRIARRFEPLPAITGH